MSKRTRSVCDWGAKLKERKFWYWAWIWQVSSVSQGAIGDSNGRTIFVILRSRGKIGSFLSRKTGNYDVILIMMNTKLSMQPDFPIKEPHSNCNTDSDVTIALKIQTGIYFNFHSQYFEVTPFARVINLLDLYFRRKCVVRITNVSFRAWTRWNVDLNRYNNYEGNIHSAYRWTWCCVGCCLIVVLLTA